MDYSILFAVLGIYASLLGDDSFEVRERTMQVMKATMVEHPYIDAIKIMAISHPDCEVRHRAEMIIDHYYNIADKYPDIRFLPEKFEYQGKNKEYWIDELVKGDFNDDDYVQATRSLSIKMLDDGVMRDEVKKTVMSIEKAENEFKKETKKRQEEWNKQNGVMPRAKQ